VQDPREIEEPGLLRWQDRALTVTGKIRKVEMRETSAIELGLKETHTA
jgi:hypothetical protein